MNNFGGNTAGQPAQAGTGQQDALDKGVSSLMTKAGHGGQSASTTEKISDGIRSGFKKMTGKVSISPSIPCAVLTYLDVPIKDKQ